MAIVNLTPDSFHAPSRVAAGGVQERIRTLLDAGADILDLGAVSTRPGAAPVDLEEEWRRLEPAVRHWDPAVPLSVDTTRAEIVRRVYDCAGPFLVNDISAGEDDPEMLATVARLGLPFVAMHKRGSPRSMDSLTDYPKGSSRRWPPISRRSAGRRSRPASPTGSGSPAWASPRRRNRTGRSSSGSRSCRPSDGPSSSAPPTSASPAATRSGPTAWRYAAAPPSCACTT